MLDNVCCLSIFNECVLRSVYMYLDSSYFTNTQHVKLLTEGHFKFWHKLLNI